MQFLSALACSALVVTALFTGFITPGFLEGGRGGGESLLFALLGILLCSVTSYRRDNQFQQSATSQTPPLSIPTGSWRILLVAGSGLLVLWMSVHSDMLTVVALGMSTVLLGLWAWRLWWRHRYLEAHDTVTGMLNHHALHERLGHLFHEGGDSQSSLALIRLDIDRFGLYNATHGHAAGDDLLRRVSRLLERYLPANAVAGRYDADEFLIILPDTTREDAVRHAHQLGESIREMVLAQATNGQAIPVTVSIGVACFPEDADTLQGLLSAGEEALASAQIHGNGVADTQSSWRARYCILENATFSTLKAMVIAIDRKDYYTRKHSEEVTDYALWIAEEMGLPESDRRLLRMAGLIHDVGKIGIPDEVLLKPDVLTPDEYEAMKQHAVMGALMLAALPSMSEIAPIVRAHHERWDGQGYPDGLSGEEIPLLARILTVADAFSAITTDRPYRRGMDWHSAVAELQRQRGKQFDPTVVDAFLRALESTSRKHLDEKAFPEAA